MREIISVEVGEKSRWTGNHFYNSIQSAWTGDTDGDDSVFFTGGSAAAGKALVVPRLLSLGLKGSGGRSAAAAASNYIAYQQATTWNAGKVLDLRDGQDQESQNEFLKDLENHETMINQPRESYSDHLTKTACYWSDFNSAYYHPKSMLETRDYVYGDERNHFSYYHQGMAVMESADFEAEVMDERIRNFMEECDSAQGFHILADADDGFSGLCSSLVQELCQEYAKKSIVVYAISASSSTSSKVAQANQALLMKAMQDNQVLYVPLHLPSPQNLDNSTWSHTLSSQFDTLYHQTGYLSTAIYSLAAPLHRGREIENYQNMLGNGAQSTCALSLGFPSFPQAFTDELPGPAMFSSAEGNVEWARDLTLETCFNIKDTVKSFSVFSGVTQTLNGQTLPPNKVHLMDNVVSESIRESLASMSPSAQWFNNPERFLLAPSFPQLFSSHHLTRTGLLKPSVEGPADYPINRVPTVATLSVSASIVEVYRKMLEHVTFKGSASVMRHDFGQGEFGMDTLEFDEVREHFVNLIEGDEDLL